MMKKPLYADLSIKKEKIILCICRYIAIQYKYSTVCLQFQIKKLPNRDFFAVRQHFCQGL